jgi:DNA-binding MarR family transcriptional regulator
MLIVINAAKGTLVPGPPLLTTRCQLMETGCHMNADASHESLTRAVLAVFRANGALLAWGDRFAAPQRLTSARWQVLGALALADEPLTTPRVAEAMGVSRQGAQKQLDLLVAEGLIERRDNPANARSPLHRLTPKGTRAYSQLNARWEERARRLAQGLGPDDIAATRRCLSRLVDELAREQAS